MELQTYKDVIIHNGKEGTLRGILAIPKNVRGLVVFAHGSGSGRLSPRNKKVAEILNSFGLGTLLFDLLKEEESRDRSNIFDIPFLGKRLTLTTQWVWRQENLSKTPICYFGASTGAGAALWAAAKFGSKIAAVVSRGGRPDLALSKLPQVSAPTLLLVGSHDRDVIDLNRKALPYLGKAELVLIPGATHLFEEPGALEQVAEEAAQWFLKFLPARKANVVELSL